LDSLSNWINQTFKRDPKSTSDVDRKFGDKPGTDEIGVSGESILGVYPDAEARTDKLKVKDYIRMRQSDGTMAALYNILTLPVVSTSYSFKADSDDNNEEQKEFIEHALNDPPHKGGMDIPLELVIQQMLRAVAEGYSPFELVYKINDDNKIVYKKIATRDAATTYLKRADDGGFAGLHQRTSFKGHYIDVLIPPEKVFLFVYGKDKNYLYGESAFKAGSYHFETKHKLYHLANLGAQAGAIPPGIITGPPETEEKVKSKLLREFSKLWSGVRTIAYKPTDFEVEPYDTGKGRYEPLPLIEHHDNAMARSVLAQFLMLGGSAKSVGSWALSSDHSDVFMMAEHALMSLVEDHINQRLIPDLIDLNFAEAHYPKFKFDDVTPETQSIIHDTFVQMTQSGFLSPAMQKGIENVVATKLEFDMEYLEKQVEEEEKAKMDAGLLDPTAVKAPNKDLTQVTGADGTVAAVDPQSGQPVAVTKTPAKPNASQPTPAGGQKKKSLSDKRELTTAEASSNLKVIEQHMDAAEAQFAKDAAPLVTAIKDDAVSRIEKLLQAGDTKSVGTFALANTLPYRALILQYMRTSYEFGKKSAADDLKVGSPATSRVSTQLITQQTDAAFDKQMSDLLFAIRAAVVSAGMQKQLSQSLSLSGVLQAIAMVFDAFTKTKVPLTASMAVSLGINTARKDVFSASKEDIGTYTWSAILDKNTCPICASLDGSTVDYAGYMATPWQPPVHLRCRCMWFATMKRATTLPDITGMPTKPGGQDFPTMF
jgi:SPP1 gp7 family putative phage head morphogenesis protein